MKKINCEECLKKESCKFLGGEKTHIDGDIIKIVDFIDWCPEIKRIIKINK